MYSLLRQRAPLCKHFAVWAELCRLPHACLGAAWLRLRGNMLPTYGWRWSLALGNVFSLLIQGWYSMPCEMLTCMWVFLTWYKSVYLSCGHTEEVVEHVWYTVRVWLSICFISDISKALRNWSRFWESYPLVKIVHSSCWTCCFMTFGFKEYLEHRYFNVCVMLTVFCFLLHSNEIAVFTNMYFHSHIHLADLYSIHHFLLPASMVGVGSKHCKAHDTLRCQFI